MTKIVGGSDMRLGSENLTQRLERKYVLRHLTGPLLASLGACILASTLKWFLKETTAMLSTLKSKRRAVLSILLLITGLVSATLVYRTSANNTKRNRGQGEPVPLTVLQSSQPVISS